MTILRLLSGEVFVLLLMPMQQVYKYQRQQDLEHVPDLSDRHTAPGLPALRGKQWSLVHTWVETHCPV